MVANTSWAKNKQTKKKTPQQSLNEPLAFKSIERESVTPLRCSVVEPNCSHDISTPEAFFWCSASVAGCPRWSHFLLQLVNTLSQGAEVCSRPLAPAGSGPWRATVQHSAGYNRMWTRSTAPLCLPASVTGPLLQKSNPNAPLTTRRISSYLPNISLSP